MQNIPSELQIYTAAAIAYVRLARNIHALVVVIPRQSIQVPLDLGHVLLCQGVSLCTASFDALGCGQFSYRCARFCSLPRLVCGHYKSTSPLHWSGLAAKSSAVDETRVGVGDESDDENFLF